MGQSGSQFTHLDRNGSASMVDVSAKAVSKREAKAQGFISLSAATLRAIQRDELAKGNVLAVARIAAIQAAKQTWQLIPLCHQLPLSHVEAEFQTGEGGILISCTARTTASTGVEMEALTAVSTAALTIYDMCKAIDTDMEIGPIRLVAKTKQPVLS